MLAPGIVQEALDVLSQPGIARTAEGDVLQAVAADEMDPLDVLELAQRACDMMLFALDEIAERNGEILHALDILGEHESDKVIQLLSAASVDEEPISLEVKVGLRG